MPTMKWNLALASVLALATAPAAVAADGAAGTPPAQVAAGDTSPSGTTAPSTTQGGGGRTSAQQLLGKEIKNAGGDRIGEVESVLIGGDGVVKAVIVGVGGFLGAGEHDVALNWDQLQQAPDGEAFTVDVTEEQLEALPEYEYPDEGKKGGILKGSDY